MIRPISEHFFSSGADPGEGKRVTIPPLPLLAVICSRFFVVEVIFFVFLFLLRMTKGDNKKIKISKLCFYQKYLHYLCNIVVCKFYTYEATQFTHKSRGGSRNFLERGNSGFKYIKH